MKLNIIFSIIITILVISSKTLAMDITMDGVTTTYNGPQITLVLNDTTFTPSQNQMPPLIINNRTLVPVREVFEQLGGTVDWNSAKKKVSVYYNESSVILTINDSSAFVNGTKMSLDVPAKIINNKTMVPVRFISENFGLAVDWNNETKTVSISASDNNSPFISPMPILIEPIPEEPDEPIEPIPEEPDEPIEPITTEEPDEPIEPVPEEPDEPIEPIPEEPDEPIVEDPATTLPGISLAIQATNEKYSKNFGDNKGKNSTYQLVDLIISNNLSGTGHTVTISFNDENGNNRTSNTTAELYEIKSNIIKAPTAKYSIYGDYDDEGYISVVHIDRNTN